MTWVPTPFQLLRGNSAALATLRPSYKPKKLEITIGKYEFDRSVTFPIPSFMIFLFSTNLKFPSALHSASLLT